MLTGDKNNPKYNSSGYYDPTAYAAIRGIVKEESDAEMRVSLLIRILKFIIREFDFELVERIELRDRKTGRYFR